MRSVTRTVLVVGALSIGACTQASETELSAAAAALAALPTVKPIPNKKFPPTGRPKVNICRNAPDLAVQSVTVADRGIKDWLYVCAPIKNVGGRAWSSKSNEVGVYFTSTLRRSKPGRAPGFSKLPPNSTVNRCGWIRAPHVRRLGHHTFRHGECPATTTVTATLTFADSVREDSNTANDDCTPSNNRRTITLNYMVECPT